MVELTRQVLGLNSTLQELPLHSACLDSSCIASEVLKFFESHPLLPGIILTQVGDFLGMLSRRVFFEQMSRPYSLDLFSKRPIASLYKFNCSESLILSGKTPITVAVRQSLERSLELVYEPLVVQLQPDVYCLLDVHQLLLAQAQIHELAMTTLQQSQKELENAKELAETTLHSIGDAVITTDAQGYITALNPVAEKLTGWQTTTAQNLHLNQVFRVIDEYTREPAQNPVDIALLEGKAVELDNPAILVARDGTELAVDDSAAPILSREGKILGAVLIFRDITKERNLARQLSWQASHDTLTGLKNRREFERQLELAFRGAQHFEQQHVLCYIDLDRFKQVNDTCGHLAGDALLKQISGLLQDNTRKSDIVARLGGDEFCLLLHQCPLDKGIQVAQTVHRALEHFQFFWSGQTFTIGASIGLTVMDSQTESPTSALNRADTACYQAKNAGRNQISIDRLLLRIEEKDSSLS